MTLDSKLSKNVYQGNGSTTAFPFAFKVWNTSQIAVTMTDAKGVSTDVTSNCTVTLSSSGGSVTYPKSGSPLPGGAKLAITRNMPFTQGINLTTASRFDPQVLEDGLDQGTAERQQIVEMMERAVILPPTSSESPQDVVATIYASRDAAAASADAATASADAASAQATAAKNSADTAAQTVQTATAQAVADATAQATAAHNSALDAAQSAAEAAAASGGLAGRVDAVEIKNTQQDTQLTEMGVDIASVKTSLLSIAPSKGFANITGATTLTTDAFGKLHICTGTTDYTITLPAAAASAGKMIAVCISSTMSKLITVKGSGTELIEGSNTRVMWAGESTTLYCDGTSWYKLAGKTIPMSVVRYLPSNQPVPASTQTLVNTTANSKVQCPADCLAANGTFVVKRDGTYLLGCNALGSGWGSVNDLKVFPLRNGNMQSIDEDYTSGSYARGGGTITGTVGVAGDIYGAYALCGSAFTLTGGGLSTGLTIIEIPSW